MRTPTSLTVLVFTYVGAAGTLSLALMGALRSMGNIARRHAPAELLIVLPFWLLVAAWVLAPYVGVRTLHESGTRSTGRAMIAGFTVLLVIALGANAFLATSAFVGGPAHPTADGMTLIFVPVLQWIVLGVAALIAMLAERRWTG